MTSTSSPRPTIWRWASSGSSTWNIRRSRSPETARIDRTHARASAPDPALPLLQYHLLHRVDPARVVVQARALEQLLAARLPKHLRRLVADLVERLQAVRREARRHHEDALGPLLRQLRQHVIRVRPQPRLAAEQRLERLRPLLAAPAEALDQLPRRPLVLPRAGVA